MPHFRLVPRVSREEREDIRVRCPECKEDMWLPEALWELDFYQCNGCGYMVELHQEGRVAEVIGELEELGQERRAIGYQVLQEATPERACYCEAFVGQHVRGRWCE